MIYQQHVAGMSPPPILQNRYMAPQGSNSPQYINYPQPIPHGQSQFVMGHQHPMVVHSNQYAGDVQGSRNPNQQINSYTHPQQQYPQKNAVLIQPPTLNVEQNINTNSQFLPPRSPMTISNNQQNQFQGFHQQNDQQNWNNEDNIASMFWQQRCMTMLERFQWFYERFQILRNQYLGLAEQMQKMDSEEEWHKFQQHHDQFQQKIEEMQQELSAVLGENEQLLQQRKSQDGESVWQQRYQELLGNFKSLQEEMNQIDANGGGRGDQRYRELQENYNELQYQYSAVLNQLQKHRDGSGLNSNQLRAMQIRMEEYVREIQSYKSKSSNLHKQNVELQHMLIQKQEELEISKQEKFKTGIDRNKYEELLRHIEEKERQIKKLQEQFKSRDNHQFIESTLQERNRQIEQFKRLLNEKNREINESRNKLITTEQNLKNKLREEVENEKRNKEKKISQLEKIIEELKTESSKTNDITYKIENYQKKLSYNTQQISNLNQTLKKKNQELIQLRSLTYEIQKLRQLQTQYYRLQSEKDKFNDQLKKKNGQIDQLHREIQKLQSKISQLSNKRAEYNSKNLIAQIQDLNDQLLRKDGEINKYKGVLVVKSQYAEQLEEEIKRIKEENILLDHQLNSERQKVSLKQFKLDKKNMEYEKKIKDLDYEFNVQIKQTLEKEIFVLRKQNIEKQERIREFEENEILLKSKMAIFEKQKQSFDKELAIQKQKQGELQKIIENLTAKYNQAGQTLKSSQQQIFTLKENQRSLAGVINALKFQIEQNQQLIRTKNNIIGQLQQQISEAFSKVQQVQKMESENNKLKLVLQNNEKELNRLKYQEQPFYKSKNISQVQSKVELEKQESNMMQQLVEQNQMLKNQISKIINQLGDMTYVNSPRSGSLNIQNRLSEFYSKLHHVISEPTQNSLNRLWQHEKSEIVRRYEQEIRQLKMQMQTKGGSTSQFYETGSNQGSKVQQYYNFQQQKLKDQIIFYKQKCKEQNDRNQTLIKINDELKTKIDSILKIKQNATLEYYKQQCLKYQNDNDILKAKIKKINSQNKEYKIELSSKNTKLAQEYETKIFEQEQKIQQLQRKISYLQVQKTVADNDKANLLHNLNSIQSDVEVSKSQAPIRSAIDTEFNAESPKYSNIQQEFHSVLGNLKGSPKNSDKKGTNNFKSNGQTPKQRTYEEKVLNNRYGY